MKITYNNITIDFFDFDFTGKVIVSLSGGLDSAAATYLTCKLFPNYEIIPYVARDENAPKDSIAATRIVKWLQNEFPTNKIHDIEIFNFNDRNENYVSFKECDIAVKRVGKFYGMSRTKVSKILQLDNISKSMHSKNPMSIRLDGMTKNPPLEIMQKNGFNNLSETRRNSIQDTYQQDKNGYFIYQPFVNVDKKFIADIYLKNNLMDSLFLQTRSCVGTLKETRGFTKECRQCFWCYEKKWAFDLEWK